MYPLGYYSHNLHFVAYSRMMQARYRDARTWAAQLRRHVASHIDAMPMITAYQPVAKVPISRNPASSCQQQRSMLCKVLFRTK